MPSILADVTNILSLDIRFKAEMVTIREFLEMITIVTVTEKRLYPRKQLFL